MRFQSGEAGGELWGVAPVVFLDVAGDIWGEADADVLGWGVVVVDAEGVLEVVLEVEAVGSLELEGFSRPAEIPPVLTGADQAMVESIAPERQYLTVAEFAQLTRVSPKTVWCRLADGSLPKFQPGGPDTRATIPREAAFGSIGGTTSSSLRVMSHSMIPAPHRAPHSGPKPKWLR